MGFSRADDAQEQAGPIRKCEVLAIGRYNCLEDGVVRRIGGEALLGDSYRRIEASSSHPACAGSHQKDRQYSEDSYEMAACRSGGNALSFSIQACSVWPSGYGGHEAVASASKSFHETRIFRGVSKSVAQAFDRGVQPVVEIHEGVCRPKPVAQFFARDYLSRFLQKHGQDLEGLFLQTDFGPIAPEFAGTKICFE